MVLHIARCCALLREFKARESGQRERCEGNEEAEELKGRRGVQKDETSMPSVNYVVTPVLLGET